MAAPISSDAPTDAAKSEAKLQPILSPPIDMTIAHAFAEKAMGPFATQLLEHSGISQVHPSTDSDLTILDQMCGFGILTAHLQQILATIITPGFTKVKVIASDLSPMMVSSMTRKITDSKWSNFSAIISDATDCRSVFAESSFDYVFCHFGPSVVPRPHDVIREAFRMSKGGGRFAFTTWTGSGWTAEAREVFKEIRSESEEMTGMPAFPAEDDYRRLFAPTGDWHVETYVREICEGVGFEGVTIRQAENTTHFTVEDFLAVFHFTIGMTVEKAWSFEEKEKFGARLYEEVEVVLKRKHGRNGVMVWDNWGALTVVARKPLTED